MSKDNKTFDLEDRLIDFAVRIIQVAESLPKRRVGNHIGGQLIHCGPSPAPNYGEAQGAESRSDFIHKMKGNSSPQSRRGRKENEYFSFC